MLNKWGKSPSLYSLFPFFELPHGLQSITYLCFKKWSSVVHMGHHASLLLQKRSIPGAGGSFEGVLVPLWCKQGTRNMREWTPERVDWLSYWQPALKQLGTGGLSAVAGVSCKTSLPSVDRSTSRRYSFFCILSKNTKPNWIYLWIIPWLILL